MRKLTAMAGITALLLNANGTTAATFSNSAAGDSEPADPGQASFHGEGQRGSSRGRGGGGQGGGGNGGVIVIGAPNPTVPGAPYPYPYPQNPYPDPYPYPYPGSAPPPPPVPPGRPPTAGNDASGRPRPWPVWYYCNQPSGYYPYVKACTRDWQELPVAPPPPGSGPPIAEGFWEHCDDPDGYFPYVAQCRHHWVAAIASTPVQEDAQEGSAEIANWFYCEGSKNYLPYVGSCAQDWRTIPAIPPPNVTSVAKTKTAADPH